MQIFRKITEKKREKREVNVHIRSAISDPNCQAMVWVYSLDQTTVLGPFTVNCGETLTIAIDDGEWGVLVESDEEIIVDVWFSQPGLLPQKTKSRATMNLEMIKGIGVFYHEEKYGKFILG
jgi:hypothetical protein